MIVSISNFHKVYDFPVNYPEWRNAYGIRNTDGCRKKKALLLKRWRLLQRKENIDVESLRQLIAKGQVIIPANKNHKMS